MTHLIYINDNNLLIQAGSNVQRAQGYAWLKGDEVLFDTDATRSPVRHCRLAPQEINNRYWQQCDESSVTQNGAGMRHAADLIWRHLGELKQQHDIDSAVLVVPSHYRQTNLQLLLGVAKSSGIAVTGLVNKAVLALHDKSLESGSYTHLDVQLHQTVSSTLHLDSGVLKLGAVEIIQDVGIHAMHEALLKGLQKNFIQNDRFDPLHDAGTEQQLFDQLPELMQQINESGKVNIGVQHQGRLHSTSLDARAWDAFLEPFVMKILAAGANTGAQHVYVELNAAFDAALPQTLNDAGLTVIEGVNRVPSELLEHREGDAVVYLTDLPSINQSSLAKNPQPSTAADVDDSKKSTPPGNGVVKSSTSRAAAVLENGATHLLLAGQAIEIDKVNIVIDGSELTMQSGSSNVKSMLAKGQLTVLNDEGRLELQPNDRLGSQLADGVITVIQVL